MWLNCTCFEIIQLSPCEHYESKIWLSLPCELWWCVVWAVLIVSLWSHSSKCCSCLEIIPCNWWDDHYLDGVGGGAGKSTCKNNIVHVCAILILFHFNRHVTWSVAWVSMKTEVGGFNWIELKHINMCCHLFSAEINDIWFGTNWKVQTSCK